MIFDAFLFSDELKILKLRLEELSEVVDCFVLVESTRTFSNRIKPLHFHENEHLFTKFASKIRHIVVQDMPERHENAWDVEAFQRNAISRGLAGAEPDDLIIISDVDEIPRKETIRSFNLDIAALKLDHFYYKLNCKSLAEKWVAPVVLRKKHLTTPQEARTRGWQYWKYSTPVVPNAGWHFSCMQDAAGISLKLQSFSHQEYNRPEFTDVEVIAHRIKYGFDLVGRRKFFWCCVPLDATYPEYLLQHLDEFEDLIADFARFHMDRESLLYSLQDELQAAKQTIVQLQADNRDLARDLRAFEDSHSWKVTAPLRRFFTYARTLGIRRDKGSDRQ